MWAGRRLGVVLNPKHRQLPMSQTLDCAVVEIYVGNFEIRCAGYSGHVASHGKSVILGRNQNSPGFDVPNRMVPTSMSEWELDCRAPKCDPE